MRSSSSSSVGRWYGREIELGAFTRGGGYAGLRAVCARVTIYADALDGALWWVQDLLGLR